MDGILVMNKPQNMTSHDVVGQVRRLLKTKKVGHAGTLDPLATGVLVLGIGRGTKLLQFLQADQKRYRAILKLGVATDTYDCEGQITAVEPYRNDLTWEAVSQALNHFKGESWQTPPIYSALKKNGRPLYAYARSHQDIEIEPRKITISEITLCDFQGDEVTFEVTCSKGTYIRSLCVDLAKTLGYPGMMQALERLQSGAFHLADSYTLEQVANGQYQLIEIDHALKHMDPLVIDDPRIVFHGKKIVSAIDHQVAVFDPEGHLLAVYEPDGKGALKNVRGLWS